MNYHGPIFESEPFAAKPMSFSLNEIDDEKLVLKVFAKVNQLPNNNPSFNSVGNSQRKNWSLSQLISLVYIVLNFIMKLKEFSGVRKPKWLKKYHFDLIGDKSFFYSVHQKNKKKETQEENGILMRFANIGKNSERSSLFFKSAKFAGRILSSKILKKFKNYEIIDPASKYKVLFDFTHLLIILFFLITIPIEIAFEVTPYKYFQNAASYVFFILVPLLFFLIDICINFRTGYYKRGKLVTDRFQIFKHYLRNRFFWDLVSILFLVMKSILIPINLNSDHSNIFLKVLSLFFFIRLRNFQIIFEEIEEYLFLDESWGSLFSLVILIYRTILLIHFLACSWCFIANSLEENGQKSWISSKDLLNSSWNEIYLYGVYFIMITMNTVGYGDISPQNSKEIIFTIFLVFFACGFFAYSINSIGNIINEITRRKSEFRRQVSVINGYMQRKNISYLIRKKVRKYLEYIWLEDNSQNKIFEDEIINSLSESLKENLLLEANGTTLKSMQMFTNNFSEEVLKKSSFCMKEKRFIPGDIIFSHGDFQNKSIYFVKKGEIEIGSNIQFNQKNEENRKIKIGKNQFFGEIAFFSNQPRRFTAISSDFTTVFMLSRDDFFDILKEFPEDRERFLAISSSIDNYKDFSLLNQRCKSCGKFNHGIDKCHWLHVPIHREAIIAKHCHSEEVERNKSERKRNLKQFTLKKIKQIRIGAVLLTEFENESFLSHKEEQDSVESEEENENENVIRRKNKRVSIAIAIDPNSEENEMMSIPSLEDIGIKSSDNLMSKSKYTINSSIQQNSELKKFEKVKEYSEYYAFSNISVILKDYNLRLSSLKSGRRNKNKKKNFTLKIDEKTFSLTEKRKFERKQNNFFHSIIKSKNTLFDSNRFLTTGRKHNFCQYKVVLKVLSIFSKIKFAFQSIIYKLRR